MEYDEEIISIGEWYQYETRDVSDIAYYLYLLDVNNEGGTPISQSSFLFSQISVQYLEDAEKLKVNKIRMRKINHLKNKIHEKDK